MQNTMKKYDPKSIQKVNPQVLNDVSKSCTDSEHKNTGGFIFPGTCHVDSYYNKNEKQTLKSLNVQEENSNG